MHEFTICCYIYEQTLKLEIVWDVIACNLVLEEKGRSYLWAKRIDG